MLRVNQLKEITEKPLDRRIVGKLNTGFGDPIDYISGTSMIVLLNKAFGPYYSMEFSEPRIVNYDPVSSKKGTFTPSQVVEVKCTITVDLYDEETESVIKVKREGFGTASMKPKFEEMVLKTAQTDAMKKAAYSFGIALELSTNSETKRRNIPGEASWYAEEMFGTWTPETTKLYKKEWAFVKTFMGNYGIHDYNELAKRAYHDRNATLNTHNIVDVVQKLSDELNSNKKDGAA